MRLRWWNWIFLTWHALVGIWPWASPEHDLASPASVLDVTVHLTAIAMLVFAWQTSQPFIGKPSLTVTEETADGPISYMGRGWTFRVGSRVVFINTWKRA